MYYILNTHNEIKAFQNSSDVLKVTKFNSSNDKDLNLRRCSIQPELFRVVSQI